MGRWGCWGLRGRVVAFLHAFGCVSPRFGLRYSMRLVAILHAVFGVVAILHAVGCDTPCGGVCRNACVFEGVWSGLCRMSKGFLGVFERMSWGLRGRVVAFLHAAVAILHVSLHFGIVRGRTGTPPALADNVDYVRKGVHPMVGRAPFPVPCADSTTGSA